MGDLKYPRYNDSEDRRRKLKDYEIKRIILLRSEGRTFQSLAYEFNVSKTSVMYHCKTDKEKSDVNKKRYSLLKEQEQRDSLFKKRRHESKLKHNKDKLKRSEEARKYKGKATYKWKKEKYHNDESFREKCKKQARELYEKTRTK